MTHDKNLLEAYIKGVISEIKINKQHPMWKRLEARIEKVLSWFSLSPAEAQEFKDSIKKTVSDFIKSVDSTRTSARLTSEEKEKISEFSEVVIKKAKKNTDFEGLDEEEKKEKLQEILRTLKSALEYKFSSLRYS